MQSIDKYSVHYVNKGWKSYEYQNIMIEECQVSQIDRDRNNFRPALRVIGNY